MGQIHGSKGVLFLDDQGGTCQDISGDLTAITFTRSKNNPDSTTFGKGMLQRIDGLGDLSMDVTAIFNSGSADAVAGLMDEMFHGSLVSRAQYLPAGSTTGCPVYTASMRMNNYANNQPVDGVVALNFSLANAAGCMTSACAV